MRSSSQKISDVDIEIANDCASFYDDPLDWVMWAFPWGESDTPLEDFDGPDQWQVDLLEEWGNQIKVRGFDGFTPCDPIQFGIASGHGIGKMQTYQTLVPTPQGIKQWGDLTPGDELFDEHGKPVLIVERKDFKQVPMYRVSFDDGSFADVSSGHLWNVRGRQERRKGLTSWRTMETIDLLEAGVKRSNGATTARQWEIPVQGAAQFEPKEIDLHPYFVGLWLGDGSKGSPTYTKPFSEISSRLRSMGYEVTDCVDGKSKYARNISHLLNDPVFQLGSSERYIPDNYKLNTIKNRMELFRGLCDSDGEVYGSGSIGYSTTSERLAEDVLWLARSLGCKAMMQPKVKKGFYYDEQGERVDCKDCYRLTINAPFNPFTLGHRRDRFKPSEPRYTKRWIDSIEPLPDSDGMCVSVASKSGLYQTNDFIVTHNSALSAWIILFIMSTRPHSKGVVTANTSDQLRTKTWGELGKWRKMCLTGHWFEYNNGRGNMSVYRHGHSETWRVDAQTCREENSESFAGLHCADSTPWYLFDEGCHDEETEILTRDGFKFFRDLTPDDDVLTMNPDNHVAEYVRPVGLHVHQRVGEMFNYSTRGSDFSVTPNHKMYFRKYNRKSGGFYPYRFDEMENIKAEAYIPRRFRWEFPDNDTFTIPSFQGLVKHYPDNVVDYDAWMEFLGWYYSEGSTDKRTNSRGGVEFTGVRITQQDLTEVEEICKRLGYKYSIYTKSSTPQLSITDRALAEYLGSFGTNCLNKVVPEHVRMSSRRQIDLFLESFIKGDGYNRGNYDVLYTSCEGLANNLQELCLKAGYASTLKQRSLKGKDIRFKTHTARSSTDGYVVYRFQCETELNVRIKNIKREQYDGMVYCAELPKYHLLFTRRNGYCMWSGNSAVPDKIYEVAEGGKTDGEPMHFVFGNPTRNSGKFHEIFHGQKHRWVTRQIDSRTAKMTNKAQIEKWRKDWGEDSDFFRVRVLGRFPKAGDMQYIPNDVVHVAQKVDVRFYEDDPVICGVDAARGGDDNAMIQIRRGFDARSDMTYRIPGEKIRDSMKFVSKVVDILNRHKPDVIFCDSGAMGGPIGDRLRQLGYNAIDVGFGEKAADESQYRNRSAEMWSRMRTWLFAGGAIKNHHQLEQELTNREYSHNDKDQLVLERKKDMKARGLASPDWADALALTFAEHVPKKIITEDNEYLSMRGKIKKKSLKSPLDRLDSE